MLAIDACVQRLRLQFQEDRDRSRCNRCTSIFECHYAIPTIHWWITIWCQDSWPIMDSTHQVQGTNAEMIKQHLDTMCSQGKQVNISTAKNAPEHGANLTNICEEWGIEIEFIVPYTPQYNDMTECKIVTYFDNAIWCWINQNSTVVALSWSQSHSHTSFWHHLEPTSQRYP